MAIGRISGALLFSDLDRQSTDLAFTTNGKPLTYMDFTNFRFGVNTNSLVDTFTVTGTANVSGVAKIFGNLVLASTTVSTSATTGALVVSGGLGISGNITSIGAYNTFTGNTVINANSNDTALRVTQTGAGNALLIEDSANPDATPLVINGAGVITKGYGFGSTVGSLTGSVSPEIQEQGTTQAGSYLALNNWQNSASSHAGITLTKSKGTAIGVRGALTAEDNIGSVNFSGDDGTSFFLSSYIAGQADTNASTGSIPGRLVFGTTAVGNTTATERMRIDNVGNVTVVGNLISTTLYATSIVGNISNPSGVSTFSNLLVTNAGVITNFSTGNAVISGGYIATLTNATITTGNVVSWYTGTLNSTAANITTGNVVSWYTGTLNSTAANITTARVTNFGTGNAVISGGYISALANATITTANIGNVNFNSVTVSSTTGNLVLSPLLSNANAVVAISGTSALQLPSGTTAQQPAPVYAGAIRWNNSSNIIEYYNGSAWISLVGQINNQTITPNGSSTVYTLDYSTTAEGIIVSINGTLQQPGVAYTVAGTQITFTEIPLVTDIISIRYIAAGTVTAENTQEINSGNIALTTGAVLIDSFNQNTYRSAKYMASTTAASSAEFAEFGVTQFGSTVVVSNVNRAVTGSTLANITANISGSTVRVYATSSAAAQMRLQKTYIIV
jgi:hypothetical protein